MTNYKPYKVNEKKEVIAIYVNKTFKQYLKKSEVRLLLEVMRDSKGIVGMELVKLPPYQYNIEFGI
jgi:hypothetical protein